MLDNLLHPYSLIFFASFVFGIISPQCHNRRKMMALKFSGDTLAGIYLCLMGGTSGGCAAFIAGTGALAQALTPHHMLKKTVVLRLSIAIILSVASIYFSYKTPLDLLPISMVIICRFGELQTQSQRIRLVYWLTCFPWMAYHFLNGFYLPFISCILGSVSLFIGMWRHRHAPLLKDVSQ